MEYFYNRLLLKSRSEALIQPLPAEKPWIDYTLWKEPGIEDHIWSDLTDVKCPGQASLQIQEVVTRARGKV